MGYFLHSHNIFVFYTAMGRKFWQCRMNSPALLPGNVPTLKGCPAGSSSCNSAAGPGAALHYYRRRERQLNGITTADSPACIMLTYLDH
jgi:hypothetical protein